VGCIGMIYYSFLELFKAGVEGRHILDVLITDVALACDFRQFAQWQLGRGVCVSLGGNGKIPKLLQQRRRHLVICYGAGVDSTIAVWWAVHRLSYHPTDIVAVHVNYGWDSAKEKEYLDKVQKYFPVGVRAVELDLPVEVKPENLEHGWVLPGRNAYLAAIGSYFGNTIWIVSNARASEEGSTRDQGLRFFAEMTSLLSRMWVMPVRVESPVLHLSKVETMVWFKELLGVTRAKEILSNTTTCYDLEKQRCGSCYACFKLKHALMQSELDDSKLFQFEVNPLHSPQAAEYARREAVLHTP
jgi:7-cyano-7-deazaguanine synthase in queuosine biosynthesis